METDPWGNQPKDDILKPLYLFDLTTQAACISTAKALYVVCWTLDLYKLSCKDKGL